MNKIKKIKIERVTTVAFFVAVFFTVVVFFTPFANWLARTLYVEPTVKKADVILVLSGGVYPDGSLSYFTLERVVYGIKLYQGKWADKIIFSGGITRSDSASDAESMKKFALDFGIPEEDIIVESESKSTYENITRTVGIMEENGWSSALLVTTPIHLHRSLLLAKRVGLELIPASPPSFDHYRQVPIDRGLLFYFTAREYGALFMHQLTGVI